MIQFVATVYFLQGQHFLSQLYSIPNVSIKMTGFSMNNDNL